MTKTNSDESLRMMLRLLIDEIVEDLSRSGTGSRSRSVQKPNMPGRCGGVWFRRAFSKDTSRRFQRADKTIETGK